MTETQRAYLEAIGRRGRVARGDGGCTSTRTVRALQVMGLVMVNPHFPQPGGWTAALTENGRRMLAEITGGRP